MARDGVACELVSHEGGLQSARGDKRVAARFPLSMAERARVIVWRKASAFHASRRPEGLRYTTDYDALRMQVRTRRADTSARPRRKSPACAPDEGFIEVNIKVGCCGFPVSREKYHKNFDLVEVQQTFYQPPQEKTVQRWREEAPSDFEFTLKAWQLITHPPSSPTYRRVQLDIPESRKKNYGFFRPTQEVLQAWEKTEKMARILRASIIVFQCPASFQPTSENKQNLEKFFKSVKRKRYLFILEPRGKWERAEVLALCRELSLLPCVDPSKEKPFPGRIGYFRLHGKTGYRYKHTEPDLKELASLVGGFDTAYFMFNNVYMFEDALRFKQMLGEHT